MSARSAAEEVRAVLGRINDAWTRGRAEDIPHAMQDCFAKDAIIKGPDFRTAGEGKETCIKSYQEFVKAASLREWLSSDPDIDVFGDTAVATYSWELRYEMHGQEQRDSGRDVFVFTRKDGKWLASWRALLMA